MAFGRVGALGTGFGRVGAGAGAHGPVGGAALLATETDGFGVDFTYPVDAKRVALKTAGAVVYAGLSSFTQTSIFAKWVFDVTGTLVSVPAGSLAVAYDPVTHAALGLMVEIAATNLILNNATMSTQSVTVTAVQHTLSIFGTGTVTLTGVSTAGPLVGTGANNRVSLTFTPTAGSLTLTVSGSVTRAQLETGPIATSPIPTVGTTVLRQGDIIKRTPASINYSATAGSWWVDLTFNTDSNNGRVIGYTTGPYAPLYSTATNIRSYDANTLLQAVTVLGSHKLAMAFANADRALTVDGLAVATSVVAGLNFGSPGANIGFGVDASSNTQQPNCYIRKLRYVPRRKSNAELVAETA